jgi:hypothetical protein
MGTASATTGGTKTDEIMTSKAFDGVDQIFEKAESASIAALPDLRISSRLLFYKRT